jgi:hypothetical protein
MKYMNTRLGILVSLIFGMSYIISGCVLPGIAPITSTPSAEVFILPATSSATSTTMVSPTQTATVTPIDQIIDTPIPTVLPSKATGSVVEMMTNNDECQLPCWWGITPGETRWTDLLNSFNAKGLPLVDGRLDLKPWMHITGYPMTISFKVEGDIIRSIELICDLEEDVVFTEGMINICGVFTMPEALNRFGVPSSVNLSMSRLDELYDLWISYDQVGISISYPGHLLTDVEGWYVCPLPNRQRQLVIQLNAPGTVPIDFGYGEDDGVFIATDSLEGLTGMNATGFHEIYSQFNVSSCLFAEDAFQQYYAELLVAPQANRMWSQAESDFLVDMLQTNLDCDLPCWWGITPGETSWETTLTQFLSYGKSIAVYTDNTLNLGGVQRVSLFSRKDPAPFAYLLEHEIYVRTGYVDLLGARAHTFNGEPFGELLLDFERYTPRHILARFGKPSQILLHYWQDDPKSPYTVGLIFEREGLMVEYEGRVQPVSNSNDKDGDSVEPVIICLDQDHLSGINIWARSPRRSPTMAEVFKQLGGYFDKNYLNTPSIEQATGNDIEWFYENFLEPTPKSCLVAEGSVGDAQ